MIKPKTENLKPKNYELVSGLEVHVELKTKSKMFCSCSADYFGQEPNTHTCPVCLGLPGALPVPNMTAIEWCIKIGLALNCEVPLFSKFDRKNYFYPDLSKGYQISQYDQPFCMNGWIEVNGKKFGITRVHMEEDTGKLIHDGDSSLIDFNRSGIPLVEIVTEPDFHSAGDVKAYLQKLQQIIRFLDVSNADMDKGNMRLEPNISLRLKDEKGLPKYKVEVKNINSFNFVEKAINFEIKRQSEILDKDEIPAQETRGYVEKDSSTVTQRVKEEAADYRYFPDPDIPPLRWEKKYIDELKASLPDLPDQVKAKFQTDYELPGYDSEILTRDRDMIAYFQETVKVALIEKLTARDVANYIINKKVDIDSVLPAEIVKNILGSKQTASIDDSDLEKIVDEVISTNEKAVNDFKNGHENVIMFLVGQVLRKAGKVDSTKVKASLLAKIK